jgi:O-antigen biosynthesis protein
VAASGRVIVSLPNVANWRVRWMLLQGRWEYANDGILDRTHLHFYTRITGAALCADAGFRVVGCEVPTVVPHQAPAWLAGAARHLAGVVLPELLAEGFVYELLPLPEAPIIRPELRPSTSVWEPAGEYSRF